MKGSCREPPPPPHVISLEERLRGDLFKECLSLRLFLMRRGDITSNLVLSMVNLAYKLFPFGSLEWIQGYAYDKVIQAGFLGGCLHDGHDILLLPL